ncbi:hypothetical protein HMPREF2533_02806 [Bacteroides fragilis]|uniref:Uncharacterized protein n=1 Tax=Bacteroides fragilis (strain ATCC 25285 / DSM 2151 / CCUG 4856 / JCM 11019 / LMG 10263 / NCTC 9343 / Onslow / VPI 2553 / EN-2) TaxID=272559 RepID=Q5LCM1_BACFN|nr:hypothetical protein HMPREF0101_01541 [Bacteroides fragilis]EYA25084.1 hypothetical protein M103_2512 [Bacteroides fragilis str. 1007-1-F \
MISTFSKRKCVNSVLLLSDKKQELKKSRFKANYNLYARFFDKNLSLNYLPQNPR